jgi:hypothetical protein
MSARLTAVTLVLLFGAVVALQAVQASRPPLGLPVGVTGHVLYVQSPTTITKAALSYRALLADVYWMRAIQHYGGTKLSKDAHKQYDLLYPLLDLTTSLDPKFDIAYGFGAVFLAEPYPTGAGRPDQAEALLKKALAAQPGKWRFAEDLGFVYYWWVHDYGKAADWFRRGSQMPGAPNWLKALSAVTLAEGGNRATSRLLWTEMLNSDEADWLKAQARFRLSQLDAMDEIDALTRLVDAYRARVGAPPRNWLDLVRAGMLRGIPVDPERHILQLDPKNGKVTLAPDSPLNPLPDPEHPA